MLALPSVTAGEFVEVVYGERVDWGTVMIDWQHEEAEVFTDIYSMTRVWEIVRESIIMQESEFDVSFTFGGDCRWVCWSGGWGESWLRDCNDRLTAWRSWSFHWYIFYDPSMRDCAWEYNNAGEWVWCQLYLQWLQVGLLKWCMWRDLTEGL